MRDWLRIGAIPDLPALETDLTGPEYRHDRRDRLLLEAKEDMRRRGLASPDLGDALALTFAYPVGQTGIDATGSGNTRHEYDPYGIDNPRN